MVILTFILTITIALIVLFAIAGTKKNNKNSTEEKFKWNIYYFIAFIIASFFIGTREGVGVDFENYKNSFMFLNQDFIFGESNEFGNLWLKNILNHFELEYTSYFLTTATITIFLLFLSFKHNYKLLPIGILIFFVGSGFSFVVNGVRQGIALMAFLNAIQYFQTENTFYQNKSNILKYLFFIFVGALFHYSILLTIPLFFIVNKRFTILFNSKILIAIVLFGFAIQTTSFIDLILDKVIEFLPKYSVYSDLEDFTRGTGRFGFGASIMLIVNILPLIYYDRISKAFPKCKKYFILYAFGLCSYYAFTRYMMLIRLSLYLTLCSIFVFSYTSMYFHKYRHQISNYSLLNFSLLFTIIIKYIYDIPQFANIQILDSDYSLWFLELNK